ncbi:21067_t:CDS:2 [Entrophospora sp. SA101]|nr:21067_t:CDS:2 [Entrophospora sp. SA101]CAJ0823280.1 7409_t:CDS:2 [Entrophospora sp. SA101]
MDNSFTPKISTKKQQIFDSSYASRSGENTTIKFAPCTICSEPGCSTSKQITTITIKVITVVIRNEDGDSITNSFVETDVSPVVTTIETSDPSQIEVETTEYPQQSQSCSHQQQRQEEEEGEEEG